MELYILDESYRRTEVLDRFESLVWTERFQSYGDFELTLFSSIQAQNLFSYGTKVATNKSHRVMIVDEIENKTDSDGRKILTIKGSSLEKTLMDRVASHALSDLTSILKGVVSISDNDTLTLENHGLVDGDYVYFKTTGDLPSFLKGNIQKTSLTDNTFKLDNHGLQNGDKIYFKTTGTLPTGVVAETIYYAIVFNTSIFKVATTLENSEQEVAIDLTGSTSGTHTLYSKLIPEVGYAVLTVDENTFKIAHKSEDVDLGIFINIEGTQSGVHSLYWYNFGKWRVRGLPADIIRAIFMAYCVLGYLSETDIIPLVVDGNLYPESTIEEPTTSIILDLNITTVYEAIKQISEIYGLGFRLVRNYDNGELFFNVYAGDDKTTSQTVLEPVIFDLSLDTLLSNTEYTSIKKLKNVAYVFSPNGFTTVYSGTADETTSGLDKRVLYVDASDIQTPAGSTLQSQLEIRGRQELNDYRTLFAFDGEIPTFGGYVYDSDYKLGDIVEVRNENGYTNVKRVTEQIFSDDAQGEKSYPTLSSELVVTPGSWMAWNSTETWNDIPDDLDHEWQDL